MDWDALGRFIQSVGFPIAVAAYLLVRHDRTIRDLSKSIHELRETLQNYLMKGV